MLPTHVYVHVPFCARRCTYCDFAIAVRRTVPRAEYLTALGVELDRWATSRGDLRAVAAHATASDGSERANGTWTASTLYLGGGTPSRLGGDGAAELLQSVRQRMVLAPDAEITIEANPEDVDRTVARAWREAGVTRVSLGVQSFDDAVLRWMHRTHDARGAHAAVEALRAEGLDNISLDLIFALPAGMERHWRRDLEAAIALRPAHLSIYGLTLEPATPLGRWRDRGLVSEAPEESYEREFLAAHDALCGAGFEHYEISNYARPGMRSRHNASYWEGAPYAGLGPSAHAFDGTRRAWNASSYTEWRRRLLGGQTAVGGVEELGTGERRLEEVYLGLRTVRGVRITAAMHELVDRWSAAGWAVVKGEHLTLTAAGWLRLDAFVDLLTEPGSHFYV